jgi:hypothetical protein
MVAWCVGEQLKPKFVLSKVKFSISRELRTCVVYCVGDPVWSGPFCRIQIQKFGTDPDQRSDLDLVKMDRIIIIILNHLDYE